MFKLIIKTPERPHWRRSDVFIVNFDHISKDSDTGVFQRILRTFLREHLRWLLKTFHWLVA